MSPASSERQRRFFCIALGIKKGHTPKSYSKEAAHLAATMSEEDLRDFCHSEVKGERLKRVIK